MSKGHAYILTDPSLRVAELRQAKSSLPERVFG